MFSVDAIAPSATVKANKTWYKGSEAVTFTVDFSEALSTVPELSLQYGTTTAKVSLTKISDTNYTTVFTTPAENAVITAKAINITDAVGNIGTSQSVQILVDADLPTANLICNDADALIRKNQSTLFEVTFSEVLHTDSKPVLLLKSTAAELQIPLVKVNDYVYKASFSDFTLSGNYTTS